MPELSLRQAAQQAGTSKSNGGVVAAPELTVSFLFWVSVYVAAGVLFERPSVPTWQQELALGVGVFALLMALLSIIESAFGDARERVDRAAELQRQEQAERAAELRRRLRGSCREGGAGDGGSGSMRRAASALT